MNDNLTEIVFILDRSGSMEGLTADTIGGFNSFVDKQKELPGEAVLTTVLFDDKYELLHNGVNLKDIKPLTEKQYFVRVMTALLDAVGKTINTVGERLAKMEEADRPAHVLFVITTDGEENSSRVFGVYDVRKMIQHQTDVYNWQFIFLGAGIDAVASARTMGIKATNASNYVGTSVGTQTMYDTVSDATVQYRAKGTISEDWNKDLNNTEGL